MWQLVNQTVPPQCWVGYGTHCSTDWARTDGIRVQGAQRLQHGDVKVLAYLRGVKILNMFNLPLASIDPTEGETLCKIWCYSDIACQYWQYNSQENGCWVDARLFSTVSGQDKDKVVKYPLAIDNEGAEADASWQIGEYIAHYCPPQAHMDPTQPPVVQPPQPPQHHTPATGGQGGGLSWSWMFAILLLILAAAGGAYYLNQQQKEGKGSKSSRSARRNRRQEEDSVSSFQEENDRLLQAQESSRQGGYNYDDSRGRSNTANTATSASSSVQGGQQQQQTSARNQSSAPYSQGYSGQQGQSFAQVHHPYSGQTGVPPPTQLVDFGQNPGRMAPTQLFQNQGAGAGAPTQLLNQGMPYQQGYGQRPQGLM